MELVQDLENSPYFSLDLETTGLFPYLGDKAFAMSIATQTDTYYLGTKDFHLVKPFLEDTTNTVFLANAKFDLSFLYLMGIEVKAKIHDVLVVARILDNTHISYSLSDVANRIGFEKSKEVDEHIKKHRLYRVAKNGERSPAFDMVPEPIMEKYAKQDARITFDIGMKQIKEAREWDENRFNGAGSIQECIEIERKLTPVLFEMERRGVRIDLDYCKKALEHEKGIYEKAKKDYTDLTSLPFIDSARNHSKAFDSFGIQTGLTDKGNPSFTDDKLALIDHPLADIIRTYREAYKKAHTYYENFLKLQVNGFIHANFRQAGTATGRMSMSNPNLQNQVNEEGSKEEFIVRKAFIPDEGHFFLSIDFKSLEFRAMLSYAGEEKLLDQISEGFDPHQATADMVGVTRKQAKTLNFMLLYGGGAEKLGHALGISTDEAKKLKDKYFRALPKVKQFMKAAPDKAKLRGYVTSLFGMPYFFKDHHYKACNFLIQGSTAQAMKKSMVDLHEFLSKFKGRMVTSIHDEILFSIPEDEKHIIPDICKIMKAQWPINDKVLDVDLAFSYKSFGELEPYVTLGK